LRSRRATIGSEPTCSVRLLKRFVGKRFGAAQRSVLDVADRREKFGRFGIASRIVAAIGLGQRLRRIERSRLDSREGSRIADAGRRDRDFALHRLVGDEAPQAEL